VGCSLASSLVDLKKELKRSHDPDFLFIEPSEMVVTQELRDVTAMGLRDIRYDIGPFISLVDGPLFEFLWSERRILLLGQVKDADLVAVSRADSIEAAEMAKIRQALDRYCSNLIALSVRNGEGLPEVLKRVCSEI
jgi:G3E family GTPase